MISTYNIGIFLIIFSMATTPTVMRPPTIASVLASNSVGTSAASSWSSSSGSSSTPASTSTPVATTPAPTTTPSAQTVGSIGYYTSQWMTLAQAQKARRDAMSSWVVQPTTLKTPDSSLEEGSVAWYQARWFDANSAKNLAKDYAIKMWNTTSWSEDPNVVGTQQFAEQLGVTLSDLSKSGQKVNVDDYISMYGISGANKQTFTDTFAKRWGINTITDTTKKTVTPTISQKVQVGKLVSDFKIGLWSAGWDRAKYYNNINYDSLSPNAKVVADRLFDSKKKDDEPTPIAPIRTVTVISSVRNPDGTYTNRLSDGTTSIVRETPTGKTTASWVPIMSAVEVWDRAGLKTVTPTLPADSVAAIRAANPWMSVADARAEAEKRRLAKVPTTTTTTTTETPTNIYEDQTGKMTQMEKDMVAEFERQQKEFLEAGKTRKEAIDSYVSEWIASEENAYNQFEQEQNRLVSEFEWNRLNQVQWDLRRVLLERWVDVSKVTPEQLIALSWSVWVNAFKDVSAAKERATAAIEQARQNKLAKVQALKQQKMVSDAEYNQTVANINSQANTSINNIKLKTAETIFGIKVAWITDARSQDTTTVQNVSSILKSAWFTNTNMTPEVGNIINSSKTIGELYNKLNSYIVANPNIAAELDKNLKASGWSSLSDQLALMNYQLNAQKFSQDTAESNRQSQLDAYKIEKSKIDSLNLTNDQKIQMYNALDSKYFWTVSPTPVSGGA